MKILFLHGLESPAVSERTDYLNSLGYRVFSPVIPYGTPYCYDNILNMAIMFKPDLIIGSSMGGYFAYHISTHIDVPILLLNPGLHHRPKKAHYNIEVKDGPYRPKHYVLLGLADIVIPPAQTIKEYEAQFNGARAFPYLIETEDHGHQTPNEKFIPFFEKVKALM